MEKVTERFGDFVKRIRTSFIPKMTLKQLSEKLVIPLTLLSDIENNRKKPFDKEKIELFGKDDVFRNRRSSEESPPH